MKQIFSLILCLFAFTSVVSAQSTKKIKTLETKRTQLKKKINQSETKLKKTQTDVKSQLNTLNKLSGKISEQRKVVSNIETEVGTISSQLTIIERDLTQLRHELTVKKQNYKRSMLYLYRNRSTQDKLMFIFSADNFSQMFHRLRYVQEYANFQRVQGEQIQAKEVQVRSKQNELLAAKTEKNRLLSEGKKENAKLESQHKEHQGLVQNLQKQQKQLQTMLNSDRKQYGALNAQIDRLIQIEIEAAERRRKAAEAARQKKLAEQRAARKREEEMERKRRAEMAARTKSSSKKSSGKASKREKSESESYIASAPKSAPMEDFIAPSADRILSNSFEANKGRLPMPITGSYVISSHYGQYSVQGLRNVQLDNKGINITGKSGARARAIFSGEVSAVFSFGGCVNVLVRHGKYISVYCNLSSASVSRGQRVNTRDIIGTVASDNSGGYTLHFQLRKETTKLNPESWLGR